MFYLQDLNQDIAKEAFEFLNLITTNPNIYKSILFSGKKESTKDLNDLMKLTKESSKDTSPIKSIKWETQLDEKNIYKLIYSLQIIESFLEDIEISSDNVESFSNEEIILEIKEISIQELKALKMDWMKVFIKNDGYSFLIKILENKLCEYAINIKNNIQNSLMNNICLDLLLRISRVFYSTSLNKFKVFRKINNYINELRGASQQSEQLQSTNSKQDNQYEHYDQLQNKESSEAELTLSKRKSSSVMDSNELKNFFKGELSDKILNSCSNPEIILNLIESLNRLTDISNKSEEESNIFLNSFSFLTCLLGFAPNVAENERSILGSYKKEFEHICFFGIINKDPNTRILFSDSLITLSIAAAENKRFEFISYLFTFVFRIIENMKEDQEKNSSELFDLFSNLFDLYFINRQ